MQPLQVAFFLLAVGFVQASENSRNEVNDFRLPTHIQPEHYVVLLEPHFENDTFSGTVLLDFTVEEETQNITLHAYQLEIDETSIILTLNDSVVKVLNVSQSEDDDNFFVIYFNSTLVVAKTYKLQIFNYRGCLNSDMFGFIWRNIRTKAV